MFKAVRLTGDKSTQYADLLAQARALLGGGDLATVLDGRSSDELGHVIF